MSQNGSVAALGGTPTPRSDGEQPTDKRVRAWLRKQRDDLINMSRRNRLLHFKHTKTASLEIALPTPDKVLRGISRTGSGGAWEFFPGAGDLPRERRAHELVVADKDDDSLDKALRLLKRKTDQEFVDKGVWVLYLGLGMLDWVESADDDTPSASPLLLVPVTLVRDSLREPFRLRRTEDDPVLNPALAVKLDTDFGLTMPAIEEFEEVSVESVMRAVEHLVRNQSGWSVTARTVLSTFTFQKEAMYRDLLLNEDLLAGDPMIQLLALGPEAPSAGVFDFEPVPEDELDVRTPPEDLVSIRDADASQRTCVLAARDGRSFVMDGPPGTGKSQTITNIIAELMHAGKTVLFVSEKAAALDVVHSRLSAAKLDEFVLKLHSHDANRKVVAQELGSALAQRPRATESFPTSDRADLVKRRQALSSYAQALNEVRQPLGSSLHEVLGEIAELQSVPQAPVPTGFGRLLEPDLLTSLRDTAAALGRAWGPVLRGDDFLWRDLANTEMSASRRNELEGVLEDAMASLDLLRRLVDSIDEELGLGWSAGVLDARRQLALLTLLDERQEIPADWLTANTFDRIDRRFAEISGAAERHAAVVAEMAALVGGGAVDIDPSLSARLDRVRTELDSAQPSWRPDGQAGFEAVRQVTDFLRDSVVGLSAINADASRVAASFGLRAADLTLTRVAELAELAGLVGTPTPPEPHWFNPAIQAALDDAARILGELLADFRARRDALRAVFTDGVLALDLHALNVRFAEVHRGLGKLRRAYRQDKRALGGCTVAGRVDRGVRARLAEAVAWQELSTKLSAAESRHANLLGDHYYRRDDADFDHVSSAIEVAHKALRLAGAELDGAAFSRQLARAGSPDPDLPSLAVRLRAAVTTWTTDAERLLGTTAERLQALPIGRVAEWCTDTAGRLAVVAEAIDHVSSHSGGGPASLAVAGNVLDLAKRAHQLRESVESGADEDRRLFGARCRGIDTDWAALRSALAWAAEVREQLGGPVLPRVAEAVLGSTVSTDDLDRRLTVWLKNADRITAAFTGRRAEEIAAELCEDFADVRDLLNALARTVGDIEEWATHAEAKATLDRAGLEPVVSFCVERKISGDQVAPVVNRALLEAWADDVLAGDRARIGALRAVDRDALVKEFQELDRKQMASAAARIINTCANRRPTSKTGEAGIIDRQAGIDRRHMPIRTLLDRAGHVAQLLKPCFMMSPLSVSQYLPPSLRFDAVIFDEASQVKPSDAVNCVYRGRQLIVAGDQKQLPPTSFGQRIGTVDDDTYDEDQLDEFESLLDLCKAGALGSLPLNWHYRSKHEALITYSNYEFYSGGLLTFPGATDEASDVGIELFKVDGVYRRGGARDNPIEAATVVERVLHHRRNHPDRTLGVVTFSGAQEDAIERELERQTRQHPELAGLDTDDRLRGFFVKNLENVQGDERDIIVFSVGYGPDEHGKFTMSMGPLTWKMGWRRLNVAITRAKHRVEIVTSVLPEQFSASATSLGVQHLRRYLDFAQRGIAALALDLDDSSGDAESPFEEEVLRSIRGWGYDAVPQVGVAGYRIDIGIRHPARPGTYALGVECDGAMYHSSKVARDRDRLRQQVLEGLGWRIHRIWGTAWYRDRAAQEARLRDAIEAAVEGRVTGPVRQAHVVEAPAVRHESVDLDAPPSWAVPYRPAEVGGVRTGYDMHEPEARGELRRLIEEVVRQEGPVHEDRVLRAVRDAWGAWRSGSRMKVAFTTAVHGLTRSTIDRDDHGFLKLRGQSCDNVRTPTNSRTEREVKHVPRDELRLAVQRIVADAHTITHDDLSRHVARLFGWQRRGPDIRAILDEITHDLLRTGDLHQVDGNLTGGSVHVEQQPEPSAPPTPPARTPSRVPTLPAGLHPRRQPHH